MSYGSGKITRADLTVYHIISVRIFEKNYTTGIKVALLLCGERKKIEQFIKQINKTFQHLNISTFIPFLVTKFS